MEKPAERKITGVCEYGKPCPDKTPGTKTCYWPYGCCYKKKLTEVS